MSQQRENQVQQPQAVGTGAPVEAQPKWYRYMMRAFTVAAIVIAVLIYIGGKAKMGTKYAVNDKESVNYSGTATEADAKALGAALKEIGYFTGEREKDVLLKKDAREGTTVSFVVEDGAWNDAKLLDAMKVMGEALAPAIGGKPLTVKLIDDKLNDHKDVKVQ